MAIEPVIVTPNWPTLSKAGRRLVILSVPWFFASLFGSSALGLVGRDDPQAQRWLVVVVAIAPIVVLVFHRWLGHVPGLRWLLHRTQPRLTIRAMGLDLRLPEVGERLYGWDAVGGLRMRPDRGANLLGPDGVALAKIPESMVLAAGNWWRSESIASVVVRARPDRYRLSGANWAGVPNEFALRDAHEPITTADPWAGRRRMTNVAIAALALAVTAFLVFRYLTS